MCSVFSNYHNNQVCLLCLNEVDENAVNTYDSPFHQFLDFSKSYLKVISGDKLEGNLRKSSQPGFCNRCDEEVTLTLKLYSDLNILKCKLAWKLMTIGNIITGSKGKAANGQEDVSRFSRNSSSFLLQIFRQDVARKCDFKSKRILPNVIIFRGNEKDNRVLGSPEQASNVKVDSFRNDEGVFESVFAGSILVTIPTRETLRVFTILLFIFSLGQNWNLEKLLLGFHNTKRKPQSSSKILQEKHSKRPPAAPVRLFGSSTWCSPSLSPPAKRKPGPRRSKRKSKLKRKGSDRDEDVLKLKQRDAEKHEISFNVIDKHEKTENAVEKIEVNLPSPEPSMVALDFAAADDDDTFFGDFPTQQDYHSTKMDAHQSIIIPDDDRVTKEIVAEKRTRKRSKSHSENGVKAKSNMDKKRRKTRKATRAELVVPKKKKRSAVVRRIGKNRPNSSSKEMSNLTIKCSDCDQRFTTLFPLHDHLQKHHSKSPQAGSYCSICNTQFENDLALFSHLEENHENPEEKPNYCFYCFQSFTTEQSKQLHGKNVHWIYPQQFPCEMDECLENFECTRQLKQHYNLEHSNSDMVSCKQCHWSFPTAHRLRLHQFSHEEPNTLGCYQCPKCPNQYQTALELAAHFNRATRPYHYNHHSFKAEEFQCDMQNCELRFFSGKELGLHREAHAMYGKQVIFTQSAVVSRTQLPIKMPIKKERIKKVKKENPRRRSQPMRWCAYCKENFDSLELRAEHENCCSLAASPERRKEANAKLMCGKCFYVTDVRGQMWKHLAIHREAQLPCPHCDSKFTRPDHVRLHIVRKHSGDDKKIVCHICGVKRATEYEMNYHMAEHEKRHLCPECGQKFSRAWLLSVHMRRHTGEKIMCEWCPRIYRCVSELKKHYEAGHPQEFQREYKGKTKRYVKYRLVKKGDRRRRENKEQEQVEASGVPNAAVETANTDQEQPNFSWNVTENDNREIQ